MSAAVRLRASPPSAWRRHAVLAFLCGFAALVLARAFYLQVVENEFLTREGNKRQLRTLVLQANRGAIRDRNGAPLALSAPVDSIWVVPSDLLGAPPYLTAMARLLNIAPGELKNFLSERADRQFVYLKRQIDPDEAKRFLLLGAPGVFAQREYRRYYPAGEVAAQVVGFCDIDGKGQEGIEAAQDEALRGIPGSRRVIRDRAGRVVEDTADYTEAQPGREVRLTLDLRLQYLAYRELKRAVEENHARGGIVVLADPRSGDILALANQPSYNPNRPDDRDSQGVRDRAVTDSFEPGSTIKPLLISQALDRGAIDPALRIDTGPGYFKVGALTVHDVHPNGVVDLAELLSKSSNVGAAKIGLTMGAEAVWAGYQRFGLGEPVGVGLPGEAPGVLRNWHEWGQIATATAAYGYGVAATALQMVRAYSAIANDGLMPQLSILQRTREIPPQRVITAATAREVRALLEGVVAPGGTAAQAAVAGYRVAGKTGTVRKNANGSYLDGQYNAVFVGMLPAAAPRLVGFVMIEDPAGRDYYGGSVAGPVFARIMQGAARLLQIPPDAMPPQAPATTVAALAGVQP